MSQIPRLTPDRWKRSFEPANNAIRQARCLKAAQSGIHTG